MAMSIPEQLRLAALIIETGHPFEASHKTGGLWCLPAKHERNVLKWPLDTWEIRLALAVPPDGMRLHNPNNLTAEQVGAGFRLGVAGERIAPPYAYWTGGRWVVGSAVGALLGIEWNNRTSIRLPLSTPWPKPEALKPDPYARLKAAKAEGKTIQYNIGTLDEPRWEDCYAPKFDSDPRFYRVKPIEEWVDLEPKDVPPGSVFRAIGATDGQYVVPWEVDSKGLRWRSGSFCKWSLVRIHYEINRPRNRDADGNPTLWEPCKKLKQP